MARNLIYVLLVTVLLAGSANALGPLLFDPSFEDCDVAPGVGNAVLVDGNGPWISSYGQARYYENAEGEIGAAPTGGTPDGDQLCALGGYNWPGSGPWGMAAQRTGYILQVGDVIDFYAKMQCMDDGGNQAHIGFPILNSSGGLEDYLPEGANGQVGYKAIGNTPYVWLDGHITYVVGANAVGQELNVAVWRLTEGSTYGSYADDCHLFINGEDVTIPEPATMVLLALGGLVAIRRRS